MRSFNQARSSLRSIYSWITAFLHHPPTWAGRCVCRPPSFHSRCEFPHVPCSGCPSLLPSPSHGFQGVKVQLVPKKKKKKGEKKKKKSQSEKVNWKCCLIFQLHWITLWHRWFIKTVSVCITVRPSLSPHHAEGRGRKKTQQAVAQKKKKKKAT